MDSTLFSRLDQVNLLLCHSQLRLIFSLCQYIFGCCVGQVACAVQLVKIAFFQVVFHFNKNEVVFHLQKIEVVFQCQKLRSSYISNFFEVVFRSFEVIFHFIKNVKKKCYPGQQKLQIGLLSWIVKIVNCFAFLDIKVLLSRIAKIANCFAILDSKKIC